MSLSVGDLPITTAVAVIGTGFGGSVMASRLAEGGRDVCVLERGKAYPRGPSPVARPGHSGVVQRRRLREQALRARAAHRTRRGPARRRGVRIDAETLVAQDYRDAYAYLATAAPDGVPLDASATATTPHGSMHRTLPRLLRMAHDLAGHGQQ